jgi:ferredoxin
MENGNMSEMNEKTLEDIQREAEERACPVQRMKYFIGEFIEGPMCSRCYPCSLGTAEAKIRLDRLSTHPGHAGESDRRALRRIAEQMIEASFCKKGKDTGRFILAAMAAAEGEMQEHLAGVCPTKECRDLIEFIIAPDACTMCGKCLEACHEHAIIGETREMFRSGYLPFEIRLKRCTRCGECLNVCPTGAIQIVAQLTGEPVRSE